MKTIEAPLTAILIVLCLGFLGNAHYERIQLAEQERIELERKLEQLRALENKMSIHVGYIKSSPLSVDTEEDLNEVKNLMKKNEKN